MVELGIIIGLSVIAFFTFFFTFKARYKRCPSDQLLVVYGRVKGDVRVKSSSSTAKEYGSAKVYHGGGVFVWPIIQDYKFMSLSPMSFEVDLRSALSKQNIRVNVPSTYTVAISSEQEFKINAAERMLGYRKEEIVNLASDIIFGQMRAIIATLTIEEINADRDSFLSKIQDNVENELKKVGLKLINVNIRDINDESGYISALGKEAAAHAINEAKKSVAEKNRDGEIGVADASREQRIKVADAVAKAEIGESEANKDKRIQTSAFNANAVEGENTAAINIANTTAARKEAEAEADRKVVVAQKTKAAQALEESYRSEKLAEDARAKREESTKYADIVVPAKINKQKVEVDAEAEAERIRRVQKGEADGIFFKMDAEARGIKEIMTKQAEGFAAFVEAAGGDPDKAVQMMIADKLPEIIKTQVEAIKNIKFDKINVWDSVGGGSGNGSSSTAGFLTNLLKTVPPLNDAFKMVGTDLPGLLQSNPELKKYMDEKEAEMTEAEVVEEEQSKSSKKK